MALFVNSLFAEMKNWINRIFNRVKEEKPAGGYDRWAASYDNQPDNLILRLDEEILGSLLNPTGLQDKAIADIGCGTGRHWPLFYSGNPVSVTGFDVSKGMLSQLKQKYPPADTHLLQSNKLSGISDASFDFIISTLAMAHIKEPEEALHEWNRVLKPGGEIIITDYHPEALKRDAKRTFQYKGKTIAVESHIHPLEKLRQWCKQLGWTELRFAERIIDEQVKHFYEKQNAAALYKKFYGMPLIYGMHFKKEHAAA